MRANSISKSSLWSADDCYASSIHILSAESNSAFDPISAPSISLSVADLTTEFSEDNNPRMIAAVLQDKID